MSVDNLDKPVAEEVEVTGDLSLGRKDLPSEKQTKPGLLTRLKNHIYHKPEKSQNIWHLLTNLTSTQRITFTAAFFGWTLDAFDFFSVSLSASRIAEEYGVQPSDVIAAVTTTLMLRPVGALIFGALADKYGRRWPLIFDIILFSVVNMATGFAPNLQVFIGLRAVFGIAMGGEWGLGASLALESLPVEARGLFSGIYQQGYACGYLLAALVNYSIVQTNSSWRILFWVGASFALLGIVIRIWVPESESFENQKKTREVLGRSLFTEMKTALKEHWLRIIYMVILMAFMNFFSHGSQDLYPTFLITQLEYTPTQQTVTNVIMNVGAIVGGTLFGYLSNSFGRRFIICVCAICAGAFIPLWIHASNIHSLQFGAFMMQFFVQGAWGVIPAHVNELAPSSFRGLIPGLTYQLGNLISAASGQIEAIIGEKNPIRNDDGSYKLNVKGEQIANYGLTQGIFMGCVCVGLFIIALIGKEERNKDFNEDAIDSAEDPTVPREKDVNEMEEGNRRNGP
ncbi:major facilitator superfamily domain-containing protein [Pilobolus umbonatus]|nr:major facilitator superfamily domain-containing protein [Pilobolus umbonatus]